MDLFKPLLAFFDAIIGLLNHLLDFLERVISPITGLLQRLTGLGLGG